MLMLSYERLLYFTGLSLLDNGKKILNNKTKFMEKETNIC